MNLATRYAAPMLALILIALHGCEAPLPSEPPSPTPGQTVAEQWEAWRAIADGPEGTWDVERAITLASQLAATPGGLDPMIAYVADEDVAAPAKVLVIMCLTPNRDVLAGYSDSLAALTAPERPSSVRAFGAHLLGLANTEAAVDRVFGLADDADRAVREAAMGVLVSVRGDRVADRLPAFWRDPATSVAVREQIILGMDPDLVASQVPLFAEAVVDSALSAAARYKAATVLGEVGGASERAALQACARNDSDPYVQERARQALALLDARSGDTNLPPAEIAGDTGDRSDDEAAEGGPRVKE